MSVSGNCMRQLHEGVEFEDQMNVGKKMGRERERRAIHGSVKQEQKVWLNWGQERLSLSEKESLC